VTNAESSRESGKRRRGDGLHDFIPEPDVQSRDTPQELTASDGVIGAFFGLAV
jgi:hypothetical protein